MLKKIIPTLSFLLLTGLLLPCFSQRSKQKTDLATKEDPQFLENIVVDVPLSKNYPVDASSKNYAKDSFSLIKAISYPDNTTGLEHASVLQFKYALLLNLEVEEIQNLSLFSFIDQWMGIKYKLGGASKTGIDCSAFMQVLFTSIYGVTLPRTARQQYTLTRRVSKKALKEGDLLFFNTVGGISHVGMYLQNNKFVHASSSGVTISDLYDDYWSRKFICVRRVDVSQNIAMISRP
ncbi:MAG: hypothetical protein NVS1B13_10660 [Flavisolibacter sp.]